MKKIITFILVLTCMVTAASFAQNRQVSGTVSDDKGPVEGVTVTEKGIPQNATGTNERGRFTLTLRGKTNVLLFTSASYLPKEVNATGAQLTITLATDPKGLGEVIVVGYARQKKVTVTGSVSSITGAAIRENPSASIQNGLVGKLPGFSAQQRSGRPGADGAAFFIRGVSSFTGSNQPLIIVDDIEYSYDQFSVLDPNEIESISILKDASTTAIYGIKGANGVVVVATRRGKLGAPKISFRTEYATMEPTVLPKYLDSYNTALLFNQAQINDNSFATVPVQNFQPRWNATDLQLFQDGTDPYLHPNINWYDVLFKKYSHQTRSNIDISGGTERVKYFVSMGYIDQGGLLKDFSEGQGIDGNYFNKRFNYRSNLDIKASNTLDFRVDLYGNTSRVNNPFIQSNNTTNGQKNDAFYEYSSFQSLAPYAYPIKNPDGSWAYSASQDANTNYDANNIVERLSLGGYQRNYNDNMNFITSATQKLDVVTRGLSVKALISYASNYNYGRNETRQDYPSFIYNPVNNSYVARDPLVFRVQPLTLGYDTRSTFRDFTIQGILNYDHTFGSHHVYGLALLSRNSKWSSNTSPDYNFIPVNFQGLSSRIGYDYKQKYLVELNVGYNGTDRFEGDKRFGTFPAASVGWNIAQENFFKNALPFIDIFKLKGSYGIVGSDQVGNFGYVYRQSFAPQTTGYTNSNTSFTNFLINNRIIQGNFGISSATYNNLQEGTLSNLVTWEKVKKLNLGLDFGLFQNKVSGTIEFFKDERYDILTQRGTVSQLLGITLPPVNLGRVKNEGYDIEVTYRDKIGQKFNFSIRGTYSYANNTRINIDEAPPIQPYQASTGRSIGDPLLYKWTGSFYKDLDDIAKSPKVTLAGVQPVHAGDLKYEDINGDGVINDFDRGFFGSPNLPRVNYGMQLQMGYGKVRFSLAFQGTGNFSVNGTEEAIRAFSANLTDVHAQSWTPQLGDNAKYPILTFARGISDPGVNSTFWSKSGKYLRLRTADISYSLPQDLLKRLKVDDIRVYINGNNLVTWSKFFDLYALDPEAPPGTDRTTYPPQKVYNIGLNITF
ncbi:MAG: TonB-dependent receptor [Ferruginibacter sp.]|nr:TonB-dependent receptor [Ferruginibacter sp.]